MIDWTVDKIHIAVDMRIRALKSRSRIFRKEQANRVGQGLLAVLPMVDHDYTRARSGRAVRHPSMPYPVGVRVN